MKSPEVSRRAVVRTAAWSVPAVSLAAAAPAFAGSDPGAGTFQFTYDGNPTDLPGVTVGTDVYYDLVLAGAFLALGESAESVDVVLRVQFMEYPNPPVEEEASAGQLGAGDLLGWVSDHATGGPVAEVIYTFSGAHLVPDRRIPIDGVVAETAYPQSRGFFILEFSAVGFETLVITDFRTPERDAGGGTLDPT